MKKMMISLAAATFLASVFTGEIGAQSKQNSPMNRCVRKCDSTYKACMGGTKKRADRCSDDKRKCRNACAKRGGR